MDVLKLLSSLIVNPNDQPLGETPVVGDSMLLANRLELSLNEGSIIHDPGGAHQKFLRKVEDVVLSHLVLNCGGLEILNSKASCFRDAANNLSCDAGEEILYGNNGASIIRYYLRKIGARYPVEFVDIICKIFITVDGSAPFTKPSLRRHAMSLQRLFTASNDVSFHPFADDPFGSVFHLSKALLPMGARSFGCKISHCGSQHIMEGIYLPVAASSEPCYSNASGRNIVREKHSLNEQQNQSGDVDEGVFVWYITNPGLAAVYYSCATADSTPFPPAVGWEVVTGKHPAPTLILELYEHSQSPVLDNAEVDNLEHDDDEAGTKDNSGTKEALPSNGSSRRMKRVGSSSRGSNKNTAQLPLCENDFKSLPVPDMTLHSELPCGTTDVDILSRVRFRNCVKSDVVKSVGGARQLLSCLLDVNSSLSAGVLFQDDDEQACDDHSDDAVVHGTIIAAQASERAEGKMKMTRQLLTLPDASDNPHHQQHNGITCLTDEDEDDDEDDEEAMQWSPDSRPNVSSGLAQEQAGDINELDLDAGLNSLKKALEIRLANSQAEVDKFHEKCNAAIEDITAQKEYWEARRQWLATTTDVDELVRGFDDDLESSEEAATTDMEELYLRQDFESRWNLQNILIQNAEVENIHNNSSSRDRRLFEDDDSGNPMTILSGQSSPEATTRPHSASGTPSATLSIFDRLRISVFNSPASQSPPLSSAVPKTPHTPRPRLCNTPLNHSKIPARFPSDIVSTRLQEGDHSDSELSSAVDQADWNSELLEFLETSCPQHFNSTIPADLKLLGVELWPPFKGKQTAHTAATAERLHYVVRVTLSSWRAVTQLTTSEEEEVDCHPFAFSPCALAESPTLMLAMPTSDSSTTTTTTNNNNNNNNNNNSNNNNNNNYNSESSQSFVDLEKSNNKSGNCSGATTVNLPRSTSLASTASGRHSTYFNKFSSEFQRRLRVAKDSNNWHVFTVRKDLQSLAALHAQLVQLLDGRDISPPPFPDSFVLADTEEIGLKSLLKKGSSTNGARKHQFRVGQPFLYSEHMRVEMGVSEGHSSSGGAPAMPQRLGDSMRAIEQYLQGVFALVESVDDYVANICHTNNNNNNSESESESGCMHSPTALADDNVTNSCDDYDEYVDTDDSDSNLHDDIASAATATAPKQLTGEASNVTAEPESTSTLSPSSSALNNIRRLPDRLGRLIGKFLQATDADDMMDPIIQPSHSHSHSGSIAGSYSLSSSSPTIMTKQPTAGQVSEGSPLSLPSGRHCYQKSHSRPCWYPHALGGLAMSLGTKDDQGGRLSLKSEEELLRVQRSRCLGCGEPLVSGLFGFEKNYQPCRYTGGLFCTRWCHADEHKVVPHRLLLHWDLTPHRVCKQASAFLAHIWKKPILDVSSINCLLYEGIPALRQARTKRENICAVMEVLMDLQDPLSVRDLVCATVGQERVHLCVTSENYSMADILDIQAGPLLKEMTALYNSMIALTSPSMCDTMGNINTKTIKC